VHSCFILFIKLLQASEESKQTHIHTHTPDKSSVSDFTSAVPEHNITHDCPRDSTIGSRANKPRLLHNNHAHLYTHNMGQ